MPPCNLDRRTPHSPRLQILLRDLDRQLPLPSADPNGEPSFRTSRFFDLLRIVEVFATAIDDLPVRPRPGSLGLPDPDHHGHPCAQIQSTTGHRSLAVFPCDTAGASVLSEI
jgi:hypothetical protein